jgi:hypothetical protein
MAITDTARQQVRERACFLCEYCHSPEKLSANRFTLDHLTPQSLGGSDDMENLALACRRCNERRSNFIKAIDPITQTTVSLFNPRQQQWNDHFTWNHNGTVIEGISAIGRATCIRLDLNDERYPEEDSIQATRQFWLRLGIHPPASDRREASI